jgi:pyridoxal phosphate enzyme (YggS family)
MAGRVSRRDDIAANLAAVRHRIAAAAARAQRDPRDVTLIAVTKTRPASDVRLLAELGVHDIGENRDQEARPKAAACADLELTWHFVGRLQTNKCRSVATYADVVHSVDRPKLVTALAEAAARADRQVGVLLQVSLDDPHRGAPGSRGGASPSELAALADATVAATRLRLLGLMAVAPLGAPARPAFQRLADLSAALRRVHPDAGWISAGMTADLEDAVLCGATHVRVGSALLGRRPPLR